ncbi:PhoPQ-activated pathogenicity-related protein PqaA type [Thiorhodococcus drewsii AZ1]|uniref:PhoPQ-activated pathogenicity-related protein PqaA type n=1 Tax=Thiorhodococcus drewsii AZ1 TaxID=765913 RepID=G2DZB5_9GAMM|nr:PhoPQ-activated protein PqaA family protein [Thiorhodococcus drewsii]EGV32142.1 PhoPQ-activated pathogenicity-related protein PqaA type [Thiorhodococcus drewsii AZ1]
MRFSMVPVMLATALILVGQTPRTEATALDDYVAKPDPSYGYSYEETRQGWGYGIHVVDMTSQQWRSPSEVDRTLWRHELLIAVPWIFHSGNQGTAILIVNGGGNIKPGGTENDELLGIMAATTGSVVAMLSQVPNQPLQFADESAPREEDAILAYGMDKYLTTGDPEWLPQLPMTKAVVRALDSIQTFAATYPGVWPTLPTIDDAIIVGGSKRGWTTWLTAAVESSKGEASRIRAILPASIDLLHLDAQFDHHWEAYGFYAPAIQDYVDFDIPCRTATPEGQAMLEIIDPYAYRDRLTMPKLVVNSSGDQFFLPDSSQFYWAGLPEPKQLRYSFNTDHSQSQDLPSVILPTLSWLSDVLDDTPSPRIDWTRDSDGSIRVWTDSTPKTVKLWQTTNPNARDFRLDTIGAAWTSTPLQPSTDGSYVGRVAPPPEGWTAFAVEVTFPGATAIPTPLESDEILTTDVHVVPEILPYAGTVCPAYPRSPIWLPDNDAAVDHGWRFVDAPSGYTDAVVIAGPPSFRGPDPGVARLRAVGPAGFELRFQEWDYRARLFDDVYHAIEDVPFAVLEPGRRIMTDGSVWEVGTFDLGGTQDWKPISFGTAFDAAPKLFLTVQTANGIQAVTARARQVTATGFQAALFEEEALNEGHTGEVVGYLAIHSPTGSGLIDLGDDEVSYALQSVSADTRWTQVLGQQVRLEEEASLDPETDHVQETLDALLLGDGFFVQQVTDYGSDTTALRRLESSSEVAAP